MSHRAIEGLRWARFAAQGPFEAPRRVRGAKAQGLRYEKALAHALRGAEWGRWIEFEDRNGHGWAQPDLFFALREEIVVLEAKYTWVAEGHSQGELLYKPLLEHLFRKKCRVVVVCKVLTPLTPRGRVFGRLEDAVRASAGGSCVLHWIGTGGLN